MKFKRPTPHNHQLDALELILIGLKMPNALSLRNLTPAEHAIVMASVVFAEALFGEKAEEILAEMVTDSGGDPQRILADARQAVLMAEADERTWRALATNLLLHRQIRTEVHRLQKELSC